MTSRWADSAEDAAEEARRKAEKEEKKRSKAERQRKAEDKKRAATTETNGHHDEQEDSDRPTKRRRLSFHADQDDGAGPETERKLLRFQTPGWQPCRSVERFNRLNHIEEGSYGFVSRAREEATGEIVAIKKLKLNPATDGGFPVTALREIQCLNAAKHRHIVDLREVVTGEGSAKEDVYLVMEFLEHDLKTLQDEMEEPFMPSEVKTLLLQLGSAVEFLHDHWILHRDLKTSNILMNNRGEIKIADFGMARFCGDPPPNNLTQLVVTLWYRAPELLLGATTYDSAIDMWSLGCIFGELLTKNPLMQGKNEVDQLSKIFELCGIPSEDTWPGFKRLPNARTLRLPSQTKAAQGSIIRSKFATLTSAGSSLLNSLLSLNPAQRPTAKQMLEHPYFREDPRPKPTAMFPTFPSKAGQEKRRRQATPNAPVRGAAPGLGEIDYSSIFKGREEEERGGGFQLKLV
ncbi:hypothetical protein LTR37_014609 [Vermiconidia calcicola]|uniref:Uncharacterized protein n=1 Tax=Vermiconidia calcicola TaxID=1690605 RepID=A0ACC3MT56_9PEZI|nr:hypothetical protein LTR37_014609 [Vermiconidia calcicola]